MPFLFDSAARRLFGAAAFASVLALAACGGGETVDVSAASTTAAAGADAAPTTTAQADSGAGVVAADQLPSILSTAAGLPSEQDLGQTQSL